VLSLGGLVLRTQENQEIQEKEELQEIEELNATHETYGPLLTAAAEDAA
jgi:hypothetical protein